MPTGDREGDVNDYFIYRKKPYQQGILDWKLNWEGDTAAQTYRDIKDIKESGGVAERQT